ncbi:hypothetical protein SAMD00019534_102960 [Acytostelium subglobosum LB1]|uniref:hypothetical protein n=1 Tax=Acytostelium subglobosum LB1 TaxID=1410327 RepID=UPI0006448B89|nr:hypothetical protein SAMD00019534_102960 [Acytostelium subglobosum LB1]GAM27121.1 hypothetical protein SAMD00019534_102960 [Acytostelium subglobosum LB1]|eukprot:XP_012750001.1 hypothetical protein SAMD00019534_102960 [Acytostelium subglobosum LB1]
MDIQFVLTPVLKSSLDRVANNVHRLNLDREMQDFINKYSTSSVKSIPYSLVKSLSTHLKYLYQQQQQDESVVNTTTTTTTAADASIRNQTTTSEDNNNKTYEPPCYLQDILRGATIYIEPKPKEVIDPEKVARRLYLQNMYEEQHYKKMTKNITQEKEDEMELASISSQASIVLNILATFFTLLACGIFAGGKWFGSYVVGLAIGLGCGIFGVAVEVWLFIIKASTVQHEKDKEKKRLDRVDNIKMRRLARDIKKDPSHIPLPMSSLSIHGHDTDNSNDLIIKQLE